MAKGHAGVCLKCFSNPYAKKEPWPLVQLAALAQGWSKPSAHKEEFGEGLPAVLNGSVVAYVTYGTNDRAGSLICTECWSNGKRAEHDKQPSAFHSSPSNNLDALLAEAAPAARHMSVALTPKPASAKVSTEPAEVYDPIKDVDILLRSIEFDSDVSDKLATLSLHIQDLPPDALTVQQAVFHLNWDPERGTFPELTPPWEDFEAGVKAALHAVQARQQAKPPLAPLDRDHMRAQLIRFCEKAIVLLEGPTASSISKVNSLTQALPVQAQHALLIFGLGGPGESCIWDFSSPPALKTKLQQARLIMSPPALKERHVDSREPDAQVDQQHNFPASVHRSQATADWNDNDLVDTFTALGIDPEVGAKYAQQTAARLNHANKVKSGAAANVGMGGASPSTELYKPEADTMEEQGEQLTRLFKTHIPQSDKERITGKFPNVDSALTIHSDIVALKRDCQEDPHSTDFSTVTTEYEVQGGFSQVLSRKKTLHFFPHVTYLNSFSEDDLHHYFSLLKAYINRVDSGLLPTLALLKRWVWNIDTAALKLLHMRAPADAQSKELALHLALGRLFMARYLSLTGAPSQGDKPPGLTEMTSTMSLHAQSQVYLHPAQADMALFKHKGFVRKAPKAVAPSQAPWNPTTSTIPSAPGSMAPNERATWLVATWDGCNSSKMCKNCGTAGHSIGLCPTARREDLPCQICYGVSGPPHHEDHCQGVGPSGHEWASVAICLWRKRIGLTGLVRTPPPSSGADATSGN